MLPKNVLYYGREEPLPEQQPLHAGPLTMLFEKGDLRYIRWGDREILRRVYVAIRDRNWGTIEPQLGNVQLQSSEEAFSITFDVENRERELDFAWKGVVRGEPDGTLTLSMDGVARSSFLRNRIGFCVLHPATCAGQSCRVEHLNGRVERASFPWYISPHQPFKDIRAITHEVLPGVWAEVRMTGDTFEMEDQRNWTDASYKTYSTPLDIAYPVQIEKGTRIQQTVTLKLLGQPAVRLKPQDASLTLTLAAAPGTPLPQLGLGLASHGQPATALELERLRALRLSHLRVDLDLVQPDYRSTLQRAITEAQALGVSLEVALHVSVEAERELIELIPILDALQPPVCRWLIFPKQEKATTEPYAVSARTYLGRWNPDIPIGGGTDAYFTELNRNRPPASALDVISYSLNPQVHAFDNASLAETLPMQAVTVESARQFSGGVPIVISAITLRPRFNPHATGPAPAPLPGELPERVDARQMSLFGAGWTMGSLKSVATSGALAATYYETTGWEGVMERPHGSPKPQLFRSLPDAVFPLYHVLADIGDYREGEVLPATSSDPLRVEGLALAQGNARRVLIANLTAEPQTVTVASLPAEVQVRLLDERNAEEAMRSPEEFRKQPGETQTTSEGQLTLELLPYAIARLDGQA